MANTGQRLANSTYDWANNKGNPLLDEEDERFQNQANKGNWAGDQASDQYQFDLADGGYNKRESSGILGATTGDQGGTNIPGLEQLSSVNPDEAHANFLTPDEQSGIEGDPRAAAIRERGDLNAAIDPSKLGLNSRYGTDMAGRVAATGSKLNDITGSKDLGLSDNFNSKYEMTPEQENDIVNSASRDVSNISQGDFEDAVRRNNAAGVGPLGMGALRARMARSSSSDAAAAATKARIAESAEAANRVAQAENMRLGAKQSQAGLQTGAAEYTGTQGVSTAQDAEAKRLAAEGGISDREMQAAATSGNADAAAENAASSRATTLGTNRQTTQQGNSTANYNRGMAANTALSGRYGQVGGARLGQQNVGAAGLADIQKTDSNNANTALGLKNSTIGTVGGVENNASQTVTGAQQQPGTGSKILGGVLGGLGAAASFFEDGGIATKPTVADIAETGPEMVVPLSGAGGSPDSRPIGGTDAQPRDPFQQEQQQRRNPVDIGHFKNTMRGMGAVADGVNGGMNGRPFQSRYGQPPDGDPGIVPQQRQSSAPPPIVRSGDDDQFGGAPKTHGTGTRPMWQKALGAVGGIAGGVAGGMGTGGRPRYGAPPQQSNVATPHGQPTGLPGGWEQNMPPGASANAGPPAGGFAAGQAVSQIQQAQGGQPPQTPPAPSPTGPTMTKDPVTGQAVWGMPAAPSGQPMAAGRIVNRPTRAILGDDGPEAVVPLSPRPGSRMRPSAIFGRRYGAA